MQAASSSSQIVAKSVLVQEHHERIYTRKGKVTGEWLLEVVRCPATGQFGHVETMVVKRHLVHSSLFVEVQERFFKETDILRKVGSHANVVSYLAHWQSETPTRLFVMELAMTDGGQNLGHYYDRGEYLDVEGIIDVFRQAAEGLAHIHANKVLHRDLKPDNLLIDTRMTLRICDFDHAVILARHTKPPTSRTGTRDYFAPEVICKKKQSFPVDVHCLGATIHQLLGWEKLVSNPPLEVDRLTSRKMTLSIAYTQKGINRKKHSQKLETLIPLIKKMELRDPKKRPTAEELKEQLGAIAQLESGDKPGPSRRTSKSYSEKRFEPDYKQVVASSRTDTKA